MLFKMKQSNLIDKMEESEQYRDRYDRVLKIKSEKLDKMTEKHRAERDILLQEVEKVEGILNTKMLRHGLVVRDIEKEQDRQEKIRRLEEQKELELIAAEKKRIAEQYAAEEKKAKSAKRKGSSNRKKGKKKKS